MIRVECYIDDELIYDADVRSATGVSNLTDWTDDGIRTGAVRENNANAYELEQDGATLVLLASGLDASGEISGNSRHYAWQKVESLGTDNQHGIKYNDNFCHIMYLYNGTYYYNYLTGSILSLADLDDVDYYVILLWTYSYDGTNEWMIVDNYLSGDDQEDTVA